MRKQTTEEFKERIKKETNNRYELLSEYINPKTKIKVMHKKCGYVWETSPYNIFKIHNCPMCENKWKRTTEDFKKEIQNICGDEYKLLSEYKGTNEKVLLEHTKCGNVYEVLPREFKKGKRCPKCMRPNYNQNTESFKQRVFEKYGDKYEILSEYKSAREHITVKCNNCGKIWQVTPDNLISKRSGCPVCSISKGEDAIKTWLDANNKKYITQYTDKRCKHIRLLKFDFAILKENNELDFLIEYDGQQHFSPVRFTQKMSNQKCEKNYNETILKDTIKEQFCIDNNIPLYRISEKNLNKIPEVLENIFNRNTIPWETFLHIKKNL